MGWWCFGPADGLVWSLDTLLDKARVASARGGWAEGIWKRIGGSALLASGIALEGCTAAARLQQESRRASCWPAVARAPERGMQQRPGGAWLFMPDASLARKLRSGYARGRAAGVHKSSEEGPAAEGEGSPFRGPVATRTQVSMYAGMSEGSLRACWAGQAGEE